MTLKVTRAPRLDTTFFEESLLPPADSIPLYNISGQETLPLSRNRADALYTRGHAYEHKGWYYANDRRSRSRFRYEACEVSGGNHDRYLLLGVCLPGDEDLLRLQIREMAQNFRF